MTIHVAMNKYGSEYFVLEKIEDCDNENLNDREVYWISYYDSYNNGYNSTLGGEGFSKINYNKVKELWDNGLSVSEIISELSIERHSVAKALKSFGITELELKTRALGKGVRQYSLAGMFIKEYGSLSSAAREVGGINNISNIKNVCTGKTKSAYGYLWQYVDDDTSITERVSDFQKTGKGIRKLVCQYDLDDNFIKEYNSCREAARSIGAPYHVGINSCCLGRQKTAYGYKWKYKEN